MEKTLGYNILDYYLREAGRIAFLKNTKNIARSLDVSVTKLTQAHKKLEKEGYLIRISTLPAQWILSKKGREFLFKDEENKYFDESTFGNEKAILDSLQSFYNVKESEGKKEKWYFYNKELLECDLRNLKLSSHKMAEFYTTYNSEILQMLHSITKYGREEEFSKSIFAEIRKVAAKLSKLEGTDLWKIENQLVYISICSMAAEPKFFIGFERSVIDRYIQEGIDFYFLIFLGKSNIFLLFPPSKVKEIFTEDSISIIQQGERIRERYLINFFLNEAFLEMRLKGSISEDVVEYLNNPQIHSLEGLTTLESKEAQSILYLAINLSKISHLKWILKGDSEELDQTREDETLVTAAEQDEEESIKDVTGDEDLVDLEDTDIVDIPEPNAFLDIKEINLTIPEFLETRLDVIEKRVAIDREILHNIITELVLNKNIILYGPPGCGKTILASFLSKIFFDDPDDLSSIEKFCDIVTATADWTTNDVIGGLKKVGNIFQPYDGYIIRAVKRCRDFNRREKGHWLVIDEFNRADIDKAFGSMFTAIEYREIIHPFGNIGQKKGTDEEIIKIPRNFRIICTMNSFDKGHLFPLSYGLLRRFAVIEIPIPPVEKEKRIVLEKAHETAKYLGIESECDVEDIYTKLVEIFAKIRTPEIGLKIGTSHLISVVNHSLGKFTLKEGWDKSFLEDAIIIHVLPQFDGLSDDILEKIHHVFGEVDMPRMAQKIDEFRKFRMII